jgi:CRISPR system Cascade subunit CasD
MPERRWLILRLEAPLAAFGAVTIDQLGVTRDFPAASMLTGLIGNALGWERTDSAAHQALQDRLVFAARRERENELGVLTDTQSARLYAKETGWTTRGTPEGRNKDSPSFSFIDPTLSKEKFQQLGKYLIHQRRRDYHADACVTVALRLKSAEKAPDLDRIASALDRPARPLFIGRKPCLPSTPIYQGEIIEAATAFDALNRLPRDRQLRAIWPLGEGPAEGDTVERIVDLPDLRNWQTGLHGGSRRVVEGFIGREAARS